MLSAPTHPGVYIEEVPSGVRPIAGVATSIAAFIGFFSRGPVGEAIRLFSFSDYERELGGLRSDSEAAYAVEQFFLNGGTQAWVVRATGAAAAAAVVLNDSTGAASLVATAASPGAWGNQVRIDVDDATVDPSSSFNLRVREVDADGDVVSEETFRNLTIGAGPRHVVDVVDDGSKLIRVEVATNDPGRPAPTGTVSAQLDAVPELDPAGTLTVALGGDQVTTDALGTAPDTLSGLAARLQRLIRAQAGTQPFARNVTVEVAGTGATGAFLVVRSGSADPADLLGLSGQVAAELGLEGPTRANVQHYALGGGAAGFQNGADGGDAQPGTDGSPPDGEALSDALAALDRVDVFNILSIPDTTRLADTAAGSVMADATAYCARRRAFYLIDVPHADATRDELTDILGWLDTGAPARHPNAAVYFPRPLVADPLNDFRLRPVAASGTVAGLYARTDAARGVWKAPAGTEATLVGVQKLEYKLTDAENGVLNPLGVNSLRNIPPFGNIAWGARTTAGADQLASEWKYVPVRRLALFLEESLFRGLHWVVFEPNDEPLWAQVRLNVEAFLQTLFRQGAFQGATPREAYFVKCDSETTTAADVAGGVVNVVVGFAPLKPAEFVIIRIQQLAGQTQA